MMKELDQFTVERLERIIRNAKGVAPPTYFEVNPADIEALARIALAAKTSEPVAWWTGPEPTLTGEIESIHDHETGGHYLPLISISTTSEAALSRERFIFKVANFLCTRRQSIAREAETASMIYDMVNTQVTERQKKSIRDGISELRSHIESLGGFNHDAVSAESSTPTPNSPETPDGWVACAERLPESKPGMMWSKEVAAVTNLGDVFKLSCMGDYWQRTSEFVDSGATSITHWISLPEDK